MDAIVLAKARMAVNYDAKNQPIQLQGSAWIRLVRHKQPGYVLPHSSKLSPIRYSPFPIKRQVGRLAYELDLPHHVKIHPVISIALSAIADNVSLLAL